MNFTSAIHLDFWMSEPGRERLPLLWENKFVVSTGRNCPARWWQRWCFQQGCWQGLQGGLVLLPPASPPFATQRLLPLFPPSQAPSLPAFPRRAEEGWRCFQVMPQKEKSLNNSWKWRCRQGQSNIQNVTKWLLLLRMAEAVMENSWHVGNNLQGKEEFPVTITCLVRGTTGLKETLILLTVDHGG